MKGNNCGFLHQFDKQRMPTCRFFAKYNECKEPDCPFKHSLEDVKDCNMYKLGFCIHGPNCRYRHARTEGPPIPVAEAALIGRPGHLHGAAPRHLRQQQHEMAMARREDVLSGGPGGMGALPPLPPGPPPSTVRRTETPMALPHAAGVGGTSGQFDPPPMGESGGMPGMPGVSRDGEDRAASLT
jgi:cleavage and polyadenylation specificity factor subunit 4